MKQRTLNMRHRGRNDTFLLKHLFRRDDGMTETKSVDQTVIKFDRMCSTFWNFTCFKVIGWWIFILITFFDNQYVWLDFTILDRT